MYESLTGNTPFVANNRNALFEKIKKGNFDIPSSLSPDVQDLLRQMIKMNPNERITAAEALEHKWIKELGENYDNENQTMNEKILNNLKAYKGRSVLKR